MTRANDIITLAVALLVAAALAAVAVAQDGAVTPDTEFTPVLRDGTDAGWTQREGAVYRADASNDTPPQLVAGSDTPVTVDFYGVDFLDDTNGLAVGAACPDGTPYEDLDFVCERAPAIYRYTAPAGEDARWERMELEGADQPGFVADVVWLAPDRALAVGGTGRYPYREPPGPLEDPAADPAGSGRAWLLEGGTWRELALDDAAALTAVAAGPRADDCGATATECAVAGGLRQLWTWDGTALTRVADIDDAASFRYRVRDVEFMPGTQRDEWMAFAVTSGCCATTPGEEQPRLLAWWENAEGEKGWYARTPWNGGGRENQAPKRTMADSLYALITSEYNDGFPRRVLGYLSAPGGEASLAPVEPASRAIGPISLAGDPLAAPGLDSTGGNDNALALTGAASTAGAEPEKSGTLYSELTNPILADVRLVSGDGDFGRTPDQGARRDVPVSTSPTDGIIDWAVGEELGDLQPGRAVAMTTLDLGETVPNPLDCPDSDGAFADTGADCRAADDPAAKAASRRFFFLPSFRLNAYTARGPDSGWAVGDKGAIVQRGGGGSGAAVGGDEPTPFKPARADLEEAPDTAPWDPFRPVSLTADPGVVPPLVTRGLEPLGEPSLVPAGIPVPSATLAWTEGTGAMPVSGVAMSADGRQGWAVGPGRALGDVSAGSPMLYRYDGERWLRCDIEGVPHQLPPEPACEGLAAVLGREVDGRPTISDVARVPLERDDDPDNDDQFEAIAVGERRDGTGALLRYRGGRWEDAGVEINDNRLRDVVPLAPDEIWIAGIKNRGSALGRYDAETGTFVDCWGGGNPCGLPAGLQTSDELDADLYLTGAGERVYLGANRKSGSSAAEAAFEPVIVHKEHGGEWTTEDGGCLPCSGGGDTATGRIAGLSVATDGDGYAGWAIGRFGADSTQLPDAVSEQVRRDDARDRALGDTTVPALRLAGGEWQRWTTDDALGDYYGQMPKDVIQLLTLPEREGEALVIRHKAVYNNLPGPMLRFDPDGERWGLVSAPFDATASKRGPGYGNFEALGLGPDGDAWVAARGGGDISSGRRGRDGEALSFYRYARERRTPVFDDLAHPVREPVVDVAAAADGRVWVATASDRVYRYDRVTGWDRMRVPGWSSGRNAAVAPRAHAIAVGPDGRGLLVGQGGRIAEVGPVGLKLDPVVGTSCAQGAPPPCGTARDLRAAAVAPDGSAIAAGERRTILWRPPGGGFRSAGLPRGVPQSATFTGAAMPSADRAYLSASSGQVLAGRLANGSWSWRVENLDAKGRVLALDERENVSTPLALRDIAVDAAGSGYAVGEEGLILERDASSGQWRRLAERYTDDFTSVTLSAGATPGALVGGELGVILTRVDGRFRVARHADVHDPLVADDGPSLGGTIRGLALVPGTEPGDVEAWAAMQVAGFERSPAPQTLLHFTSDPDDDLLDGLASVRPLPDAPLPRPGELAFAAFGRSDCHQRFNETTCAEMQGTARFNEVVSRRIADELVRRSRMPGGPLLALFTGDMDESAGRSNTTVRHPLERNVAHRRWIERVARRLQHGGVPVYGAVGRGDLTQLQACQSGACAGTREATAGRSNLLWRETMAAMPEPWGDQPPAPPNGVELVRVGAEGAAELPGGGANTHYAFDLRRDGEPLMRVVVVDTSQGSLAVSEREQQPVEPGGQLQWLDRVLCRRGSTADQSLDCDLDPQTPSIVLGNTPTYTYSTEIPPTETMTDSAVFEATLLQHKVTTVVAGRLGWNGRYFATAPGLHFPCLGGEYPVAAPAPGTAQPCDADTSGLDGARAAAGEAVAQAADALQSLDPPHAPVPVTTPNAEEQLAKVTGTVAGLLDFVVASGGGGRLANERGAAGDGFWHGYTLVRVMPGNDPQRTIVEQRPVFDWISVSADRRVLKPGGTTRVEGVGREPVGSDHHIRYDAIDSPSITHRYDLVRADPEKPWRPLLDADGNYVPLPESVGTINRQTGAVKAGAGSQERSYALAILSVGEKAASLPLVFEQRRSFQAPEPPVSSTATNVTISNPPQQPPIIVLGTAATTAPPPTSPPPGATPSNLTPTFPPPLPFSAPPPINATPTATPPPPPPAPPPPPSEGAAPLNLSLKVSGLNIAPQMSTFPPPAPPVNPAPPGGARKEARQRQAAVAKSEQGSDGKGEGADAHGRSDAVDSPNSAMTRLDQGKGGMAFTAYERRDQPSAWARGALYGGGLTLAALLMAMTWTVARPRGRRRTPEVPAPAYARRRRS